MSDLRIKAYIAMKPIKRSLHLGRFFKAKQKVSIYPKKKKKKKVLPVSNGINFNYYGHINLVLLS